MKGYQQLLINLPKPQKIKKKLPLKVLFFISQFVPENQELLNQLELERSSKINHSDQFLITQLQAENSRLKDELSQLTISKS